MANLINISSKYLFGLGTLATVGISSLFSWLPRPDKIFFTATDTYVENGVRKVFSGEKQNIPAEFISSFGEGALFALTHVKDLCLNNPFYTLGVSFVVYLGYKFTNLFICSFSDVFKKIQYFFFGDSKLNSTEILEKGHLKATEDLQKLLDLQQQFSNDMCKLFLELSETITQKLIQTNELIEQSNNATTQLVMTMKTMQDEAAKSLKEIVTSNPTLINEQTTLLMTTLRRLEYSFLIKLKTINKTTRQMSLDIGNKVVGGKDQVPEVPNVRELHDQGVATDNVNIVFDSSDEDFETFASMPHDDGMTLEKFNSTPLPFLPDSDSSANSVLESFDWSIMYSIENLSMLIIFFGLLFHYCMKKNKFYGIY